MAELSRADYQQIAATYDRARPLGDANLARWLDLIAAAARLRPGARVLDLGCGTGRFALPLARQLGCRVVGADRSTAMLARARAKDPAEQVRWCCADAAAVPLSDVTLDAVLMSHLLHHVAEPAAVLREVWRLLAPGGVALVRYGALAQIRSDPEHVFFPETLAVDAARTPEVGQVEGWLRAAGFRAVRSQEVWQRSFASGAERLAAVRLRHTSVLTLIPAAAFERGVERLAAYVAERPDDPWLLEDALTLTRAERG